MILDLFRAEKTYKHVPTVEEMSTGTCGLHRCPLPMAGGLLPYMRPVFENAPVVDHADWFVDVKVHMLMPGEFPCIPNWHCDNVPRVNRELRYENANNQRTMYIWLSDTPATEVLSDPVECDHVRDHDHLREVISGTRTEKLNPFEWYSFTQLSPHAGTVAIKDGWRVFVRLTHKSIASSRPVRSVVRRHCQVYLDASSFSW